MLPAIFDPAKVTRLKPLHPTKAVFKVTYGDVKFVLKSEPFKGELVPEDGKSVASSQKQRGNMSFMFDATDKLLKSGKARPLDKFEASAVYKLKHNTTLDQNARDLISSEEKQHPVWTILEYAKGLVTGSDAVKPNNPEMAFEIVVALHDEKNLRMLGRILVVDLFFGNTDRFDFETSPLELKNQGNLFFVREKTSRGLSYSLKGLDPYDPNSGTAKLDQDVLQIQADYGIEWFGAKLKSRSALKKLSAEALRAIERLLLPAVANYDMIIDFDLDPKAWGFTEKHEKLVYKGCEEALEELKRLCKTRLSTKGGRTPAPEGLKSRLKVLGWA